MTDRVKARLELLNQREYRRARVAGGENITSLLDKFSPMERAAHRLIYALEREKPLFHGADDIFGFNRYCAAFPKDDTLWLGDFVEPFGNATVDYETVLEKGLDGIEAEARALYESADDYAKSFYDAMFGCFAACRDIVKEYREQAEREGRQELAEALKTVPLKGARSYYEALVTLRFMQYALRLNQMPHVTWGRFDQYAKPYYDTSIKAGMSKEEALELTELFFIALNLDTDIYTGIQQGDNGQSMVLGGMTADGADGFNELSEICLSASEELRIIDPKINLRVNKNTPLSLYERGTRLTKQGLGFPQYSNDDVVIPALIAWGYDEADARNYTVAACWEFIVPRCGTDVPNVDALNFPLAVERATKEHLLGAKSFDEFFVNVEKEMEKLIDVIVEKYNKVTPFPEPFTSAFIQPCVKTGRDIGANGGKYKNYGVHGVGISNAADALAAIKKTVYDEGLDKNELITALENDFNGYEPLRKRLEACPKMGNNDDYVDELAGRLMDKFSSYLNGRPNNRGGIYRAGTGSAMYYIWSASEVGATADGRHARQPFGSSFSPSLTAKINGPLSAVQSFTKYDLKRVANGGPFTIEIHDTVFRNLEGEKKVAALIKTFIDLGGHQIQINAINRDRLLDAQAHPEKYPNLIVRVWGWSGYFNELDVEYQNHVIKRLEYTMS